MARWNYHAAIADMVKEAIPQGMVQKSLTRYEWDISGRCTDAVTVVLHGRPAADWIQRLRYVVIKRGTKASLIVELLAPCRKCPACLKARMRMWTARAMHEVRNAKRTWFATLTLSPEAHYTMQCRAIAHADSRAIPTKELDAEQLFERQSTETVKEMTLFFKRVRKQLRRSNSMRYLVVRERHKSGLPHWHALIHESGEVPIPYRVLESNWTLGHSKFKLIEDERAAFYVVKYLGKGNDGRVRASLHYGRHNADHETAFAIDERMRDVKTECERSKHGEILTKRDCGIYQ